MASKFTGALPLRIRIDKTVRGGEPLKDLNCNLACIWCHRDFFHHKLGVPAISNAKIVKTVKLVIAASSRRKAELKISGQGEPTLVGTNELCDLIGQLRLIPRVSEIKLITNGILLKDMARELKAIGLNAVTISINSLNFKTYSLITQRDFLSKAIKGVRAAIKVGLKTKLNVVYSKLNAGEVLDFIRFSGKNGGIVIKFFDLLVTNQLCKELYLPLSNLQKQLESLATSKRTLVTPYRACEYHFTNPKAIIKTAGRVNECPNIACKYRTKCPEGCRSAVRISQDGVLHPCGVRTDNTIALVDDNVTIKQVRKALLSGGKNGGRIE